jgi:hypothetical protein
MKNKLRFRILGNELKKTINKSYSGKESEAINYYIEKSKEINNDLINLEYDVFQNKWPGITWATAFLGSLEMARRK